MFLLRTYTFNFTIFLRKKSHSSLNRIKFPLTNILSIKRLTIIKHSNQPTVGASAATQNATSNSKKRKDLFQLNHTTDFIYIHPYVIYVSFQAHTAPSLSSSPQLEFFLFGGFFSLRPLSPHSVCVLAHKQTPKLSPEIKELKCVSGGRFMRICCQALNKKKLTTSSSPLNYCTVFFSFLSLGEHVVPIWLHKQGWFSFADSNTGWVCAIMTHVTVMTFREKNALSVYNNKYNYLKNECWYDNLHMTEINVCSVAIWNFSFTYFCLMCDNKRLFGISFFLSQIENRVLWISKWHKVNWLISFKMHKWQHSTPTLDSPPCRTVFSLGADSSVGSKKTSRRHAL